MLYTLEVQIDGQWREITRFDAVDNGEALRAALHHLPHEHYRTPIALRPFSVAGQGEQPPEALEPDAA